MTSTAAPGAERRAARTVAAALVAAVFAASVGAGCSAGPGRAGGVEPRAPKGQKADAGDGSARPQATKTGKTTGVAGPLDASFGPVAKDWQSFRRCRAAMQRDIDAKAAAMKSGPVGSAATQLASLRLASSSRDLIDSGSLDAARSSLQRAISLDSGDGWAWLWLACVHHAQGRGDLAAEVLGKARSRLPREAGVDSEVAGLAAAIRAGAPKAP